MQPTALKPYTVEQARFDYTMKLRRGSLFEMAGRFGITCSTMRKLVEGEKPTIQGQKFPPDERQYFDRDEALKVLVNQ